MEDGQRFMCVVHPPDTDVPTRIIMIVRVGIDIIAIGRIEEAVSRWGDRFLHRIYTPRERKECGDNIASLAARFAAKEAVLKALGTGLERGITWQDVEVLGRGSAPRLSLRGRAHILASNLGLQAWTLSLTHEAGVAIAVAIGYGGGGGV